MNKHILVVFIVILFGCEKKTKAPGSAGAEPYLETFGVLEGNFPAGYLNIYFSSKNNYFLYYQLGVFDIWLIDEEGEYIQFKPDDSLSSFVVDLSSVENKSQWLMRAKVPEGQYKGALLTLDFSSAWTQVFTAYENKINLPYLFNSLSHQINVDNFHSQVEVILEDDERINVVSDKDAQLSLRFDVDASMRFMPLTDEGESLEFLVTPMVDIKAGIFYPENIIVEGFLRFYDGENIDIMSQASEVFGQTALKLTISDNKKVTINHKESNSSDAAKSLSRFNAGQSIQYIQAQGKQQGGEFVLNALSVDESPNASHVLLRGLMFKERFIGRRINLNREEGPESYFFAEPITVNNTITGNSAEKDFVGYVSAYALDSGDVTVNSAVPVNTNISGEITAINDKVIELDVLSIQGINADFILGDNAKISATYNKELPEFSVTGESVKMTGSFSQSANYDADIVQDLNKQKQRYKLSMSPLNNTPVLAFSEGYLDVLAEAVEQADTSLSVLDDSVGIPLESFPVNKIDIKNSQFILLIERVIPFASTYHYTDKELFIENIQKRQEGGFLVNAIVADGRWKEESFQANLVVVTMYGQTDLDAISSLIEKDGEEVLLGLYEFISDVFYKSINRLFNKNIKNVGYTRLAYAHQNFDFDLNKPRVQTVILPQDLSGTESNRAARQYILNTFSNIDKEADVFAQITRAPVLASLENFDGADIVESRRQLTPVNLYEKLGVSGRDSATPQDINLGRASSQVKRIYDVGGVKKSAFDVLKLTGNPSRDDIDKAYDRERAVSVDFKDTASHITRIHQARERLRDIADAFDILSDERLRKSYHTSLATIEANTDKLLGLGSKTLTPDELEETYRKVQATGEIDDRALTNIYEKAKVRVDKIQDLKLLTDVNKLYASVDGFNKFLKAGDERKFRLSPGNIEIVSNKLKEYKVQRDALLKRTGYPDADPTSEISKKLTKINNKIFKAGLVAESNRIRSLTAGESDLRIIKPKLAPKPASLLKLKVPVGSPFKVKK